MKTNRRQLLPGMKIRFSGPLMEMPGLYINEIAIVQEIGTESIVVHVPRKNLTSHIHRCQVRRYFVKKKKKPSKLTRFFLTGLSFNDVGYESLEQARSAVGDELFTISEIIEFREVKRHGVK